MAPAPAHNIPIWIGSWGSEAGLRRVARLGDGWLASAYNTTADKLAQDREILDAELAIQGKDAASFPTSLATMWTYITEDETERDEKLAMIAAMLNRPPEVLAPQILIGPPEECATKLRAYADAGVSEVFIWPLDSATQQLELFMTTVAPKVQP
jgi:alkanesulfonate monooxygenase SsuD/methylene tetrahydromethanopterin reductase-like flavin-dependent oxidoreductase (luciferase family)